MLIAAAVIVALLVIGVCVYAFYFSKEGDEGYEHESGYCEKDSI